MLFFFLIHEQLYWNKKKTKKREPKTFGIVIQMHHLEIRLKAKRNGPANDRKNKRERKGC